MKSQPASPRRRQALALAVASWAGAGPFAVPAAWAFGVDDLMRLLARNPGGEARFTETRQVQGLDQPLESRGTLRFTPPARFERHTLSPRAESMTVDGNTMVLVRGGRSRTMALDAVPEAAALVEAIRGTLTGNRAALEQFFSLGVEGSEERWLLTLSPRDAALLAQVRSVQIGGRQHQARQVDVWLGGGDRSSMSIEPVASPTSAPAAPSAPAVRPAARP